MQQPVAGMHIAHGLMHRRSQDFELVGGQTANHTQRRHQKFSKRKTFYDTENEKSQVGGLVWPATKILLKEGLKPQVKKFYK